MKVTSQIIFYQTEETYHHKLKLFSKVEKKEYSTVISEDLYNSDTNAIQNQNKKEK